MSRDLRKSWHIIVLVLVVLAYSLLSWFGLIKKAGTRFLASDASTETIQETYSGVDTNDTAGEIAAPDNKLSGTIDLVDSLIDKADTLWNSNVYMRSFLSKIDSVSNYYFTGEISSSQVLRGGNNWLFYKSTDDGDPISDYEGTNPYSDEEKQSILYDVLNVQNYFENKGISFAVLIAPNKENIYSEFMPDTYKHASISSTDTLIEYLKGNDANIVSPKTELLENHMKFQLYYSYDTHWNQLGAYIGVRDTLALWDILIPELQNREIISSKLSGQYHYCAEDDLADMVGLRSLVFNDETEYEIDGTAVMDWQEFEMQQNSKQTSYYHNTDAKVDSSILVVGDSFRSAMVPELREVFSDVYVVHRDYYEPSLIDQIRPDYLVAEYVERYSGILGEITDLLL